MQPSLSVAAVLCGWWCWLLVTVCGCWWLLVLVLVLMVLVKMVVVKMVAVVVNVVSVQGRSAGTMRRADGRVVVMVVMLSVMVLGS